MPKHRIGIAAVCLTVATIAGPSVFAQDTHFKVYGGAAYVAPMSDSDVTFGSVRDTVEAEKKVGWNLGFAGRLSPWFGGWPG